MQGGFDNEAVWRAQKSMREQLNAYGGLSFRYRGGQVRWDCGRRGAGLAGGPRPLQNKLSSSQTVQRNGAAFVSLQCVIRSGLDARAVSDDDDDDRPYGVHVRYAGYFFTDCRLTTNDNATRTHAHMHAHTGFVFRLDC